MPLLPILALAIQPGHLIASSADRPLLMRDPAINKTDVVFAFAGDLWTVPRSGGDAVRLTSSPGTESSPCFSPDGSTIAFAGQYDGNTDLFIVPAKGGEPKRLTYHPGGDFPVGWSPDGKSIVFVSGMLTDTDLPRLFSISVQGGVPEALPFPSGSDAAYSPDGSKLAYLPGIQWQDAWKRYRGGQTHAIWIGNMADSKVTEIPRKNSNDKDPMWVGNKVYFLSDRSGPFTLYSYDTGSKGVKQLVKPQGFDMKSASATDDAIVFEKFGSLGIYDLKSGETKTLNVEINADFPEVRPKFKNVAGMINGASVSPSGARVAFEARGDIFTVPAAKGDIRNLTQSSDSCERGPSWSPDGKSLAYLSDAGGEYKMIVRPATGEGEGKSFQLGNGAAYYYPPNWSPDSKKLVYWDNHFDIWYLDVETGKNTKIDSLPYTNPTYSPSPNWSPDSKWITYQRELDSHLNAVFIYSLESGKATQVTDGLSHAGSPVFDLNGKYLYFTASTNVAGGIAWLDLSSYYAINPVASIYVAVLRKDLPSPLEPQSDEERAGAAPPAPANDAFRIDLEGLGQRILALPMPPQNYAGLLPGNPGSFFALSVSAIATVTSQPQTQLWKYDVVSRRPMPFAPGVTTAGISANGEKILLGQPGMWSVVPTAMPPQPGQGALSFAGMTTRVDPVAEWKQMFHEVIRIQREFFYDPNFHGQNLAELEKRYEPFLAGVMSRDDLNYLFIDMLGEISVGHMYIQGGDIPGVEGVPGGLLGADYSLENGRYRFKRVYNGENWNPGVRAPLTQPGVNVQTGEYLISVDGKDVKSTDNIYEALEGTAGKQVKLKVGPNPDGTGAREVTVVPVPSENALRHLAWAEDNRRKVDQLSGGRVGYVHIPDTNIGGWINFNRYYYAQLGKEGMVIDERFNHGGQVDDFLVDMMNRPMMSMWAGRYGKDFSSPLGAIFGPKVLLINQYAGSGGDYFPWHFRKVGLGPLIGKRTWGGLVGILAFPPLMDGGFVTSPNIAFYNPDGKWDVENHGVDPDIEVELDPYLWRQGRDAQLERAVQETLMRIQTQKKPVVKRPPYADKTKVPPAP